MRAGLGVRGRSGAVVSVRNLLGSCRKLNRVPNWNRGGGVWCCGVRVPLMASRDRVQSQDLGARLDPHDRVHLMGAISLAAICGTILYGARVRFGPFGGHDISIIGVMVEPSPDNESVGR